MLMYSRKLRQRASFGFKYTYIMRCFETRNLKRESYGTTSFFVDIFLPTGVERHLLNFGNGEKCRNRPILMGSISYY